MSNQPNHTSVSIN